MTNLNTNINRFDRKTWNNLTFPGDFSTGIMPYYGMSQSDFAWYHRLKPINIKIFAYLHGVKPDELCSSMDALNIMFNYKNKKKSWLHRDQNPSLTFGNINSYQGIYSRYSVEEKDAGFSFIPNSHLIDYDGLNAKKHYLPLGMEDSLHKHSKKLLSPENSLIIFNSKTIHCNSAGFINRPNSNDIPRLNRMGVYLSYWPKTLRTIEILEKKKQLYRDGIGTSHWGILAEKKKNKPRWPRNSKADKINILKPTLNSDNDIPLDRLNLM